MDEKACNEPITALKAETRCAAQTNVTVTHHMSPKMMRIARNEHNESFWTILDFEEERERESKKEGLAGFRV